MLSLIIKELEPSEISTLKSLWCILKTMMTHPLLMCIFFKMKFSKIFFFKIYTLGKTSVICIHVYV